MEEIRVSGDLSMKLICARWRKENRGWELQPTSYRSSIPQIPQLKRLQVSPSEPLEDLSLSGLLGRSRLSRKGGEELEVWEKAGNLSRRSLCRSEMHVRWESSCSSPGTRFLCVPAWCQSPAGAAGPWAAR